MAAATGTSSSRATHGSLSSTWCAPRRPQRDAPRSGCSSRDPGVLRRPRGPRRPRRRALSGAWPGHRTSRSPGRAPCVSEFAVIELATALGMTMDTCRRYVDQVLEVRHRLPLIWQRVAAGDLAWWRAARIAQHTRHLPKAGAAHVDGTSPPVAHMVGRAPTERLCQEALDTFDPAKAEEKHRGRREPQGRRAHLRPADRHGTVDVTGPPTPADALDLESRGRPGRRGAQGRRGDRPRSTCAGRWRSE